MKWIIGLMIMSSSLFSNIGVIASDGNTIHANVSSEASRCAYYVFVDSEGKVLEIVENAHKDVHGGASSKLVMMLKEKKVSHIIAANFGTKLITKLKENKIQHTFYKGDIDSAIENLIK